MDGLKKRVNESLQVRLSLTLAVVIFVIAVVAGMFSFLSAFDEAHELQDDVLRQVAQLVDKQGLRPTAPSVEGHMQDVDEESSVIVQRLGRVDPSAAGVDAGGTLALPTSLADGLHTLQVEGETFRVMVRTTAAGERIAVAQESGFRNEIARDGALRTLLPFMILVPVLLLVVADLVRKMFRPIAALSGEIDQRPEQALHPVPAEHLPVEVRPFAVAINRLLARVSRSVAAQRRFVADAAHELRTPLTALSLQAERLAEADLSDAARDRLAVLRSGIDRSRSLMDQLLSLARAQSAVDVPTSPISVLAVYRRVLEDLMPLAEAKHIDIGADGADARVWVSELDLISVVRNLVDNAVRYTPQGGRVNLSITVESGQVLLHVQDTGPGITEAERERVFDPFYRTLGSEQPGSGLGLSIVHVIVSRIGAQIQFEYSDEKSRTGLHVTVTLPANA